MLLGSLLFAGCSSKNTPKTTAPSPKISIQVTSSAFADNGALPAKYTCQGEKVSPPLQWTGVPAGAKEVVIRVVDSDVTPRGYLHWFVYHIDPGVTSVAEGAIPPGAQVGPATTGKAEYVPPCPPKGAPHHYRFRVIALSQALGAGGQGQSPAIVAAGQLTGLYARR